ncbi:hypothetical protein P171DRAFT_468159 [Karstenula rhodostoma CBS 690.94]|uniref:Mid2 domain-containing protein n=1 Tax=Karstenula rhodostoma CBS 690.94 TaxID=1392251 RepID=A0A9P4PWP4_9PLEO|nr:hypothetical protein P171DRAFT_468159 [Karstenula rhodostoma CBS 690.94]
MMSIYSPRSFLVFFYLLQLTIAERKCYALNGLQLGDAYGPCNPNAKHSGCCAVRGPAGLVDLCLSNGLCMATNGEYMGTIWQSGCTDPTGVDPSCPKMCPDARDNFANGSTVAAWNVQMCDYGSYCCRAADDHNSCCNNATAPQIKTKFIGAFQFQTSTTGASSTHSPTSTASSSRSSATSSSSVPATEVRVAAASSTNTAPTASSQPVLCEAEKRRANIIGGTLAGFFSVAVISLLAAILFLFQKEKKQRKLKEHYEEQFATTWRAYGSGMPSRTTVVEGDSTKAPVEKDVEVRYIGRRNT